MAFNSLHPDGRVVDERFVDNVPAEHDISLRTGCFCNPGAGEAAFAVRVSLGLATNFAGLYRFMAFAAEFVDLADVPADLPPRLAG